MILFDFKEATQNTIRVELKIENKAYYYGGLNIEFSIFSVY